jgi:hypothetical protein
MKQSTWAFIFLAILFSGCAEYTQLFKVAPISDIKKEENNLYVFENDTLKIAYWFWEETGELSFSLFNKLNVPVYIDWKKSSFIRDGDKIDYWLDEEITNSTTYYKGYNVSKNVFVPRISIASNGGVTTYGKNYNVGASSGAATSKSVKTKPERITFLAPKSSIYESKFRLYIWNGIKLEPTTSLKIVERRDNPKKQTKIYVAKYNKEGFSPLRFRNFLTFSTSEKFEHEFYIDNEFYVSEVQEMERTHFNGEVTNSTGEPNYEMPFKDPSSFYINVDNTVPIKYRSK